MKGKIPPREEPAADDALFRKLMAPLMPEINEQLSKIERGKEVYRKTKTFRIVVYDEETNAEISRMTSLTACVALLHHKNRDNLPDGRVFALSKSDQELAGIAYLSPMMIESWIRMHPNIEEIIRKLPPPEEMIR